MYVYVCMCIHMYTYTQYRIYKLFLPLNSNYCAYICTYAHLCMYVPTLNIYHFHTALH